MTAMMTSSIHPTWQHAKSIEDALAKLCTWYLISGAYRYESRGDYLPWICEFYERDGRQLAHGTWGTAWAALERAERALQKAMS